MALQETFEAVLQVAGVLKEFYNSAEFQGSASIPPWKWELSFGNVSDQLDDSDNASFVNAKPRAPDDRGDFASSSFYFVLDNIASPFAGEDRLRNFSKSFAGFFTMDNRDRDALTAGNLVRNTFVCDFEAVTFCHKVSVCLT